MKKHSVMGYFEAHFSTRLDLQYRGEGQLQANCPFCVSRGEPRPDTRHRLGISTAPHMFAVHCFNCGYSGTPLTLIRDLDPTISYSDLKDLLNDFGDAIPQVREEQIRVGLPKHYKPLMKGKWNKYHEPALDYLGSRDVTDQLILDYQFGWCRRGPFQSRIIIPIRFDGRLVGYQGRSIKHSHRPKYLFNKGFKKSEYLFNYDRAIKRKAVIIVEGVFDALVFPKSSIALFTNQMSERQRLLISKGWKSALIMLDAKEQERAYEIYKQLNSLMSCQVVKLKSKDPSGVGKLGVMDRMKQTIKGLEILVR